MGTYATFKDMLVGKALIAAKREEYSLEDIRGHITTNYDWYCGESRNLDLNKEDFIEDAYQTAKKLYKKYKEQFELFD